MKTKKSFKGKLIKFVVENLCKNELINYISQETLQEYLNKHLSFKTEVSMFTISEQLDKDTEIKFIDEDNTPRVINIHIAQIQRSVNGLVISIK